MWFKFMKVRVGGVAAMLVVVVVEKELLDPPVKFIVGVDKLTD